MNVTPQGNVDAKFIQHRFDIGLRDKIIIRCIIRRRVKASAERDLEPRYVVTLGIVDDAEDAVRVHGAMTREDDPWRLGAINILQIVEEIAKRKSR